MSNFTGSSEHSGIPTKKISGDNSSTAGSRSRYAALRDRRAKVARSKSTAVVGFMGYNNDEGNLLILKPFCFLWNSLGLFRDYGLNYIYLEIKTFGRDVCS